MQDDIVDYGGTKYHKRDLALYRFDEDIHKWRVLSSGGQWLVDFHGPKPYYTKWESFKQIADAIISLIVGVFLIPRFVYWLFHEMDW